MTTWQIGELARATGLTVRALHHYDDIGLLVPSARSGAGHRRYTDVDVRRLHRILALRGFGLGLADIARVLDDDPMTDPRQLIRHQLDQVDERLRVAKRLRGNLIGLLGMLDGAAEPSTDRLLELIEVMTAMESPLTPEQFERMARNRREAMEELSPEQLAEMTRERERLMAGLTPAELAEMSRHREALRPHAD